MINQTLERKRKIISEFTFYYDENSKLPQWQMDELDKIDEKIKNGEIEYYSLEESHKKTLKFIDNLFSKENRNVL